MFRHLPWQGYVKDNLSARFRSRSGTEDLLLHWGTYEDWGVYLVYCFKKSRHVEQGCRWERGFHIAEIPFDEGCAGDVKEVFDRIDFLWQGRIVDENMQRKNGQGHLHWERKRGDWHVQKVGIGGRDRIFTLSSETDIIRWTDIFTQWLTGK